MPWTNADPEGTEVYFYGDAKWGGKKLPEDARERREEARAAPVPKKRRETKPAESAATPEASASASGEPESGLPAVSWDKLPGDYRGTDTLTIDMDGFPQRVETDDKAKFVVEVKDAEKGTFTFKIVDSQNGGDLCAVVGTAKQAAVEFEAGQSCLEEILGLPMTATLRSGSATLAGSKLTVTYSIELEIDAPQGTQDGSIGYRFEGERQ